MKQRDTVAIIGVGLIGSSIGLALRRGRWARRVIGVGRRNETLQTALDRGAISQATTNLAEGVKNAEFVIVCTPVCHIVDYVQQTARNAPEGVLITDVGSTKGEIVAALEGALSAGATFVGSHPMAGSEKTGPEFADARLFEGRAAIVTPAESSPGAAVEEIEEFWKVLGARVTRMSPHAHDAAVATISHVPHIAASALALGTPQELISLVGGGWLDTTRVAAGDVELWRQILTQNRTHVLQSLAEFEKTLASFRVALARGDNAELTRLLEQGKTRRDAVAN